jgi:hypothetical protein
MNSVIAQTIHLAMDSVIAQPTSHHAFCHCTTNISPCILPSHSQHLTMHSAIAQPTSHHAFCHCTTIISFVANNEGLVQTLCPSGTTISTDSKTIARTCSACPTDTYQPASNHRVLQCTAQPVCGINEMISADTKFTIRTCMVLVFGTGFFT